MENRTDKTQPENARKSGQDAAHGRAGEKPREETGRSDAMPGKGRDGAMDADIERLDRSVDADGFLEDPDDKADAEG